MALNMVGVDGLWSAMIIKWLDTSSKTITWEKSLRKNIINASPLKYAGSREIDVLWN